MAEWFTVNSTVDEILNNDRVCKKIGYFYPKVFADNIKAPFRKMKIKNILKLGKAAVKKPFHGEELIECANIILERREKGAFVSIPVWRDMENTENVVLIPFLQGSKKGLPCVIICAGGGYGLVANCTEGVPVAKELNKLGFQVFLLNYRVAPQRYPVPQLDFLRAVRFVRANSEKLGVDPESITAMGFSAGGHLIASALAMENEIVDDTHRYDSISPKPNNLCFCYTLTSMVGNTHEKSVVNLLGDDPEFTQRERLSLENMDLKMFPKTYLWACRDDQSVPVNHSELLYKCLKDAGVKSQLQLYEKGGHGCGLGTGTGAEGWLNGFVNFVKSFD